MGRAERHTGGDWTGALGAPPLASSSPHAVLRPILLVMATPLSVRLRTETTELHRLAERSGIMHGLLRGHLDRGEYVALLRALHAVYASLERRMHAWPAGSPLQRFTDPALDRTVAIEEDLVALHGAGWEREVPLLAAGANYAARIDRATDAELVAHSYVRYMGDLSGGQSLGRVIARALTLPNEDGVAFYRFEGIPDVDGFKAQFRASLDAWSIDEATADDVVREAQDAFRLNVRVFEEAGTRSAPSAAPPPPPAA